MRCGLEIRAGGGPLTDWYRVCLPSFFFGFVLLFFFAGVDRVCVALGRIWRRLDRMSLCIS